MNWLLEEFERARERQSKRSPGEIALTRSIMAERAHVASFDEAIFTHGYISPFDDYADDCMINPTRDCQQNGCFGMDGTEKCPNEDKS